MSGHGPDKEVFEKASTAELKPMKVGENGMSFMFETAYQLKMTDYSMSKDTQDTKYHEVW